MDVAVAVIVDPHSRVLITKRALEKPHGGLWEFPGGKLEAGEKPSNALAREVKEEVGLDVISHQFLGEIDYEYEQHSVRLLIFLIKSFSGAARCCESQSELCWANLDELNQYEFPEANQDIISLLYQDAALLRPSS